MKTNTAIQQVVPTQAPALLKVLVSLAGGMLVFLLLLSLAGFGYEAYFSERIFPGVSVSGIDLSGMEPVEAAVKLAQNINYPENGQIVFEDTSQTADIRVWQVRPHELGLSFDLEETISQAYSLGRNGNPIRRSIEQVTAWYGGRDLPPVMNYDEYVARAYLSGMGAQIDRPMVEASLEIQGVDVIARDGQVGRQLDLAQTMIPLERHLTSMTDGLLPLVIAEIHPVIMNVSEAAEEVRRIIREPLVISVPEAGEGDPGPWTLEREQLVEMVAIERVASGIDGEQQVFLVRLDVGKLRPILEEAAGKLARTPVNARFIFNDDTHQLDLMEPAVIGRALNIEATLKSIESELFLGNHQLPLVLDTTNPQVTSDASAEQLGIRELVSQHTSYFYGSSGPRIQNIQIAAARFHGILVAPGETFSMAEVMGDVSLDNGYAEALIIFGDRTIEGVGGGVCQVSTTLFRTAFLGGYPIVERHPHAYRVGYYEQTASGNINPNFAGLDATVYVPVVDFKFVNDTPHWLLMETYVNAKARKITWNFYSTSDGRKVEWDTTGLRNVVEPPAPKYIENKKLGKGEIRQVDWAVEGADVTVTRVVYRGGEVYLKDAFTTHYQPWRAIYEFGPGTKIPKEN
jgi:vancomycin resistance protein YoaR